MPKSEGLANRFRTHSNAGKVTLSKNLPSPRTKLRIEITIRKTMQIVLPTLAVIAACYFFLSSLSNIAILISVSAVLTASMIGYYHVIKPYLNNTNFTPPLNRY